MNHDKAPILYGAMNQEIKGVLRTGDDKAKHYAAARIEQLERHCDALLTVLKALEFDLDYWKQMMRDKRDGESLGKLQANARAVIATVEAENL